VNIDDAAHAVVHDYPGGSPSLAPRMGMSAAMLRNKVNPNDTTHHLTLKEAQRLTLITGDARVLKAFAGECDHVVIEPRTHDDDAASDMAVLEMMAALWSKQGDLGTTIHQALADGALTEQEFDRIKDAALIMQGRVAALLRRFEGMVER
jgi:hypothetical protein